MAVVASLSESMQVSVALQRQEDRLGGSRQPLQQQKAVGFCKQVLLVFVVCGMEMCITFEQIYQILILQYLGVPMSLVSVNGIICGAACMATIPIIGYITNGGSNPKRRKMASLYVGMVMFQIGLIFLLISGLVKISLFQELLKDAETTPTFSTTALANLTNSTEQFQDEIVFNRTSGNWWATGWNQSNLTNNKFDIETSSEEQIPITAYLAICGFAFVDIGFDTSAPITRTYILESVPRFQHVKLLAMATIVQSAAGTVFALLGVLDISDALGHAFMVDGTSAILIFFCVFLILVVTCGFTSTILTGYYLTINQGNTEETSKACTPSLITHKIIQEKSFRKHNNSYTEEGDCTDTLNALKTPLLQESSHDNNYLALNVSASFRSSILNFEGSSISERANLSNKVQQSLSRESKSQSQVLRSSYSVTIAEMDPSDFDDNSFISSLPNENGGSKVEPYSVHNLPTSTNTLSHETQGRNNPSTQTKVKRKLAILATSTFFTVGASMSFTYYAANALTIGIYHGDPTALPGTERKSLYDDGLRTAALGNLIFYILFTVTSLTNHKLLDLVDEKILFIVFQLVFLIPLTALLATQCIEAYFAAVIMVGLFRHTVYTLTYVMASKISQEAGDSAKKSNLGKIMSLLGFLTPTHYLIMSAIMGPLIDATGNVWIPLTYTLGCGCISVLVFSLLFIVK